MSLHTSGGSGPHGPRSPKNAASSEGSASKTPPRSESNVPVSLRGEQAPSLYADSEMAGRIRTFDWAETPLGPVESWPPELGTAVDVMLGAGEAISIYWGPTHVLLYNDAWRAFIEGRHPAALGQPARAIFPEIWDTIGPRFAYVLDGNGAAFEREQRLPLKRDGELEITWFDYSFNPIPTTDGTVGGIFNIGTEVTERVEAEEALRESEAFHRLAAEAGNMGTWSVDLETGDAVLSSRMAELMGYASGEHEAVSSRAEPGHWQQRVPREAWMASIHPDDRAVLEQALSAARDRKEPLDLEFRVEHDGQTRWLYAKGRVKSNGAGQGRRLRGASINVTQRHELEEALVSASETVRRDIGRRLHDVLSSDLVALAIRGENLRDRLSTGSVGIEEAAETLGAIIDGVRAGAEQSRTLSHVLMPVALQEEHLAAALQHLCREQAELGTPVPTFEGNREEPRPEDKETAMHLYRIANEAITNAQRHAGATRIGVRLFREGGRLVLTVWDDGEGLPNGAGSGDGIGLQTMKHRSDFIGATLQIRPADGGGTVVRCELPISRAEAA